MDDSMDGILTPETRTSHLLIRETFTLFLHNIISLCLPLPSPEIGTSNWGSFCLSQECRDDITSRTVISSTCGRGHACLLSSLQHKWFILALNMCKICLFTLTNIPANQEIVAIIIASKLCNTCTFHIYTKAVLYSHTCTCIDVATIYI